MAWNEPGNGGNKDRDPWQNNNKNQGPPDLDEVFKKLSGKFGGVFGGKGGGGDVSSFGIMIVVVIGLLIWGVSGFYTIKEAERGVVLRFGGYHETVLPGLQWNPKFIDQVIPVDVNTIRSLRGKGSMLTADENVVEVEMDVQYKVVDPKQYLFSVTNADDSLSQALDSALRYVVGHTQMNNVLTTGRDVVRKDTWNKLEEITEPYNMGLQVIDVNFLPARPPVEVKDAFDDAIAAQEDEERFIREAEAYEREKEPTARGQVKRIEQEAIAYKEQVTLQAQGEVARFEALLPQYRAAPEVTRERLYIETMQSVLSNTSKVLLDSQGSNSMMYLPLDKIMQQSKQTKSVESMPSQSDVNSTYNTDITINDTPVRSTRIRSGRE
ncbi:MULTISPECIES: FtsH protease activity modulator HflK [unclassified Motilimonas]|uniref:FtsH protease activity modulator HflK n=1 Tax=unclassified Motilimonas TaxID=2643697 RepID=UPI001E4DF8B4|nr:MULTISPECIES: FtsH protease activity modulator HflK [unclassified Motilimonas]MCE0559194.1 FtsH protease activity modulator HflK [Motilimonas sp. E26]MDO6527763.1 FtsH protease activity modulator HflK [Motilimonas sp. 1_MG-2023]